MSLSNFVVNNNILGQTWTIRSSKGLGNDLHILKTNLQMFANYLQNEYITLKKKIGGGGGATSRTLELTVIFFTGHGIFLFNKNIFKKQKNPILST